MDKKENMIDYSISGYVKVTYEAVNEYGTRFEFDFITYVDESLNTFTKKFHIETIAMHMSWLRELYCAKVINIVKSNLTEVLK